MGSLVGNGFTLWMDNYYKSPDLALHLKSKHSTDCVGTMKLTKKNISKEVKDRKLGKKKKIIATVFKECGKRMLELYPHTTMQKAK